MVKKKDAMYDRNLRSFHTMVKNLRGITKVYFKILESLTCLLAEFKHNDSCSNVGLVISPTIESSYAPDTSIKIVVSSDRNTEPVLFTCDGETFLLEETSANLIFNLVPVSSTIEHVILHVVCTLDGDLTGNVNDYVLKVNGLAEYFSSNSTLADYEYIHQCFKLEQDVKLTIITLENVKRPLARTVKKN
jgi:phosphatidylinositol-4-phosphate 3-kinase